MSLLNILHISATSARLCHQIKHTVYACMDVAV